MAQHRHKVFRAGEHEHVRFLRIGAPIAVAGQALVCFAGDRRQRQAPAKAEGPIAGAGVVAEAELRPEAAPPRASGDRHDHRAAAGNRISGELLAHAPDRPAPLRKADAGRLD